MIGPLRSSLRNRLHRAFDFTFLASLTALTLIPLSASPLQKEIVIHLTDDSDWWSGYNGSESDPDDAARIRVDQHPQPRNVGLENFSILGIPLDLDVLKTADAKLGVAARVSRGDASSYRAEVCYVSTGEQPPTHLIFEAGEVDLTLYLFRGGPGWKGDDVCVKSELVNSKLATASGIHLGQSRSEVIAVLGKPSLRTDNSLYYSLMTNQKNPANSIEAARKMHPEMSEAELQQNYGSYTLGQGLMAKFDEQGLAYFYATISESE
jgi:hypothetical protein